MRSPELVEWTKHGAQEGIGFAKAKSREAASSLRAAPSPLSAPRYRFVKPWVLVPLIFKLCVLSAVVSAKAEARSASEAWCPGRDWFRQSEIPRCGIVASRHPISALRYAVSLRQTLGSRPFNLHAIQRGAQEGTRTLTPFGTGF